MVIVVERALQDTVIANDSESELRNLLYLSTSFLALNFFSGALGPQILNFILQRYVAS